MGTIFIRTMPAGAFPISAVSPAVRAVSVPGRAESYPRKPLEQFLAVARRLEHPADDKKRHEQDQDRPGDELEHLLRAVFPARQVDAGGHEDDDLLRQRGEEEGDHDGENDEPLDRVLTVE